MKAYEELLIGSSALQQLYVEDKGFIFWSAEEWSTNKRKGKMSNKLAVVNYFFKALI